MSPVSKGLRAEKKQNHEKLIPVALEMTEYEKSLKQTGPFWMQ
jgi:hypothetical protein